MTATDELVPTDPSEVVPGLNRIVVRSAQLGLQPMIMEKDVEVPLRDGTVLYANVFRPDDELEHATVISADVYGKDSVHVAFAGKTLGTMLGSYECSPFCAWEAPDPGYWVPHGYAVVKLALRGTSGSVGHVEIGTSSEARDYYDAIEFLATQPWSSGAIATNGVSQLATNQWRVAQLAPPHLKAMIPWEGRSDAYRDLRFHGGIPETRFGRFILGTLSGRGLTPGSTVENIVEAMAAHPLWDDYWEDRSGDLSAITTPMYVGASWATMGVHTRGTIEGFRQSSSPEKWIEIHGRKEWETYYSRERVERQRRFLDHFLKGDDNGFERTPRVRIEVRESFYEGLTRFEDEWPIARTEYVPLYLDATTMTLRDEPPAVAGEASYEATAEGRPEGGVSFTHVFGEPTELTGYMKLRLWVCTDAGDDLDLFVGIHKLDHHGREVHFPDFNHVESGRVSTGWLRVSHRQLDEARSTPYQPWHAHTELLPVSPGELVPVEIEILPSATLFHAGEAVRLQVRGTEIPLDRIVGIAPERWPNRYRHDETVNHPASHHRIATGGGHDSHLLVPVVPPRAPAAGRGSSNDKGERQ